MCNKCFTFLPWVTDLFLSSMKFEIYTQVKDDVLCLDSEMIPCRTHWFHVSLVGMLLSEYFMEVTWF